MGLTTGVAPNQAENTMVRTLPEKTLLIAEFKCWARRNNISKPAGSDAIRFFKYLQRESPELLIFEPSGTKSQTMRAWLLDEKLVSH